MNPILSCRDLCCHRTDWNESRNASIRDVTLTFSSAALYEFTGPDSSGRDLLLSNLGLLEPADSGTICLDGRNIGEVPEDDLRRLRNETFGFLFQYPCLLPSFSVAENVAMPLFRICGADAAAARERTFEVLDFCGIPHIENQLAGRLAASAQHRAALARALVHRPKILVAITPRGGDELLDLALRTARELGLCVLWAGQDGKVGEKAHRVIQVRDGRIASDRQL